MALSTAAPKAKIAHGGIVPASIAKQQLIDSNELRGGLLISNFSSQVLYISFTDNTYDSFAIPPNGLYTMDFPVYTGSLSGWWVAANGHAAITEFE